MGCRRALKKIKLAGGARLCHETRQLRNGAAAQGTEPGANFKLATRTAFSRLATPHVAGARASSQFPIPVGAARELMRSRTTGARTQAQSEFSGHGCKTLWGRATRCAKIVKVRKEKNPNMHQNQKNLQPAAVEKPPPLRARQFRARGLISFTCGKHRPEPTDVEAEGWSNVTRNNRAKRCKRVSESGS